MVSFAKYSVMEVASHRPLTASFPETVQIVACSTSEGCVKSEYERFSCTRSITACQIIFAMLASDPDRLVFSSYPAQVVQV